MDKNYSIGKFLQKKLVRLSNTRKSTPLFKFSSTMNVPSKTIPYCPYIHNENLFFASLIE